MRAARCRRRASCRAHSHPHQPPGVRGAQVGAAQQLQLLPHSSALLCCRSTHRCSRRAEISRIPRPPPAQHQPRARPLLSSAHSPSSIGRLFPVLVAWCVLPPRECRRASVPLHRLPLRQRHTDHARLGCCTQRHSARVSHAQPPLSSLRAHVVTPPSQSPPSVLRALTHSCTGCGASGTRRSAPTLHRWCSASIAAIRARRIAEWRSGGRRWDQCAPPSTAAPRVGPTRLTHRSFSVPCAAPSALRLCGGHRRSGQPCAIRPSALRPSRLRVRCDGAAALPLHRVAVHSRGVPTSPGDPHSASLQRQPHSLLSATLTARGCRRRGAAQPHSTAAMHRRARRQPLSSVCRALECGEERADGSRRGRRRRHGARAWACVPVPPR